MDQNLNLPRDERSGRREEGNIPYIFIDVGGQRTNWKKWIHQFSDVNAVIFLVAISEYNQVISLFDKILHG